jgi:hypothetical protein
MISLGEDGSVVSRRVRNSEFRGWQPTLPRFDPSSVDAETVRVHVVASI